MTKPAKLPTFDRERDGNVFAWIVRTAPIVRRHLIAEHTGESMARRAIERAALRTIKP